jgi:hypothetical protein
MLRNRSIEWRFTLVWLKDVTAISFTTKAKKVSLNTFLIPSRRFGSISPQERLPANPQETRPAASSLSDPHGAMGGRSFRGPPQNRAPRPPRDGFSGQIRIAREPSITAHAVIRIRFYVDIVPA